MCPRKATSPKEQGKTWGKPERGNETETVKIGVSALLCISKSIRSLKDLEWKIYARNKRSGRILDHSEPVFPFNTHSHSHRR